MYKPGCTQDPGKGSKTIPMPTTVALVNIIHSELRSKWFVKAAVSNGKHQPTDCPSFRGAREDERHTPGWTELSMAVRDRAGTDLGLN